MITKPTLRAEKNVKKRSDNGVFTFPKTPALKAALLWFYMGRMLLNTASYCYLQVKANFS